MGELISFGAVAFSAIFFVVDPFAAIPVFLAITANESPERKRRTALRAATAATVTLLAFAAAGGVIFRAFGITLGAFKIAGGVILFLLALDMVRAQRSRVRTSPEEETEGAEKEDVALIPLAIPILAGPGSIATVSVFMGRAAGNVAEIAIVLACILLTGALTVALLRAAPVLERTLKQTGLNIVNRLMGLLLAAVAIQFLVQGVHDVLPQIVGVAGGTGPAR